MTAVSPQGFVSAYVLRRQTGIGQGFDLYDDALPAASPELPLGQVQRPGALTVENANRWIDQRTSSKFFLFLHIYEPHRPTPRPRGSRPQIRTTERSYAPTDSRQALVTCAQKGLYSARRLCSSPIMVKDSGPWGGEHGIFLYRERFVFRS